MERILRQQLLQCLLHLCIHIIKTDHLMQTFRPFPWLLTPVHNKRHYRQKPVCASHLIQKFSLILIKLPAGCAVVSFLVCLVPPFVFTPDLPELAIIFKGLLYHDTDRHRIVCFLLIFQRQNHKSLPVTILLHDQITLPLHRLVMF